MFETTSQEIVGFRGVSGPQLMVPNDMVISQQYPF